MRGRKQAAAEIRIVLRLDVASVMAWRSLILCFGVLCLVPCAAGLYAASGAAGCGRRMSRFASSNDNAVDWYQKSAKAGNAAGETGLGFLYVNGRKP